jgi:DNA repair photolyase
MHFVEAKTILTPQNGMNLYRGCSNNCIFCDARSRCYRLEHSFTDVAVKQDSARLLENMLKRKRNPGMITTGSLSDPYMAEEAKLRYMRECLKVIERYDFGVVIQTKSSLLLRDLDILEQINRKTKVVIVVEMTSISDEISNRLEPGAASATERFRMLGKLSERRIPCILAIEPVIPMVNDSMENIQGLIQQAAEQGVYGVEHKDFTTTLREGCREYFHEQLAQAFPELYPAFLEQYQGVDALVSPNRQALLELVQQLCQEHGMVWRKEELVQFKRSYENKTQGIQMSLFDFV